MNPDQLTIGGEFEGLMHPNREIQAQPGFGRQLLVERYILAIMAAGIEDTAAFAWIQDTCDGDELHATGRLLCVGADVYDLPPPK